MADPILKWAGGKRGLIPEILSLFPADFKNRNYHEPFVGGGAVFFKIRPKSGSINDVNPRLINFYQVVRDKAEDLIAQAGRYPHDKGAYYKLRDEFNRRGLSDVEEAALLLYLNKTAFNGLYRVNSKGEFNVPFGRYKNPTIVPEGRIRAASKILKKAQIFNKDFSYVLDYANEGDLCYLDPPYQPVSDTANFTSYSAEGFDLTEQRRLRDTCVELDNNGVLFVLSNSYVKPIREMYEGIKNFRIEIVQARRAISSKASTRGPINEVLITNIPEEVSRKKRSTLTSYLEN